MMKNLPRNVNSAAQGAIAITPHDTNALASPVRAVTIGTAEGVIRYRHAGADYTTGPLPIGLHAFEADLIYATGTTATGLTGWL